MGARGRRSAADLSVPALQKMGDRPEPPASLNDRAAEEWHRCVNALPSDWFTPETLSDLQIRCEAVAESEAIQLMIEQVRALAMKDDAAHKRYRELLRDKDTMAGLALRAATKLRLTHQSSYTDKSSGTAKTRSGKKPWE